ncbi:MAG: discoidin domain-containing protein [Puniceicoccales bacterium]|jgi:hypothetical protein|nr:discoidin domain-containing protein [Puniceicoccales bacterium]
MIQFLRLLFFLLLIAPASAATLNLAGSWRLALDPDGKEDDPVPESAAFKDSIQLPSSLAEAGKGTPFVMTPSVKDREAMRHLYPRFSYVGPAWYMKDIDVPADWSGREAELLLERVMWESRVWVNGEFAGSQDSLCTPHRYEIGKKLIPGKRNTLVIRVDNRRLLDIGIGHAYTDETQGYWNGIVGRIELTDRPAAHVETLYASTSPDGSKFSVRVFLANSGIETEGSLKVRLVSSTASAVESERTVKLPIGASEAVFDFSTDEIPRWSEFTPETATLEATLETAGGESRKSTLCGVRTAAVSGTQILINGTPVFLRGTLECCIFPRTGYSDTTGAEWEKIMGTVKAHGLNHIRLHSWCPPEAAFAAADKYGIYLQVELPNWSFAMGRNPKVDAYFKAEGERILREYGNHPSFVLFSLGNELGGDFNGMDEMVRRFKAISPDKLMTSTSFSFSKRGAQPGPVDDYFITQKSASGWVRGQGFLNTTPPATDTDYAGGVASVKIPLISHEVGQYVVYPNLAELPKYDGVMRATAWEAIRDDLAVKGRLADARRLTRDSGKLAVELYKEDIERALRTPGQSGIQLLDLHDFPGQSTATVGVLDAFWDSKGLVTPEAFRRFAGPVVPLARMSKRVWENPETFRARVDLANFGPVPIERPFIWKLHGEDGCEVSSGAFASASAPVGSRITLGDIALPLATVNKASKLTLTVSLPDTPVANSWDVWVYPAKAAESAPGVTVTDIWNNRVLDALQKGGRVVLTPPRNALAKPIDARFIPVFWSPLHFPNQPGTLGASIDPDHPAFADFPTETHTQWQWWELFATSCSTDLADVMPKPEMPLTFVDKHDRNALPAAIWECRVGKGALLVCTLDIAEQPGNIVARQLRRSLLGYAASAAFAPKVELSEKTLNVIFNPVRVSASAVDSAPGYPASAAVDGDPATFWHTDWNAGANRLPAMLIADTFAPGAFKGFTYTPRRDMNRGRIGAYRVEASMDRKTWTAVDSGTFPEGADVQTRMFAKPVNAQYFRLVALTDQSGSGNAAVAEFEPIPDGPGDVRDLGIVEGFNDK